MKDSNQEGPFDSGGSRVDSLHLEDIHGGYIYICFGESLINILFALIHLREVSWRPSRH